VRTLYGPGIAGRAVRRGDLDLWLLEQAVRAGARFESALVARQPLYASAGALPVVRGLVLAPRGAPARLSRIPASLVIAADGSRSGLARALGLQRTPKRPRRWAFGAYARGIAGVADVGEMHVRAGCYIGIAPLEENLANVCVVTGARPDGGRPVEVMRRAIGRDATLARRFRQAVLVDRPRVLGPLAVDTSAAGVEGLLLAGDAAGFIDPMTGDGLHLAMRGAVLAAEEALHTLACSDFAGAPGRLAGARRAAVGTKLWFNRAIRLVAGSPLAVHLASRGAAVAPGAIQRVVRYAGDVTTACLCLYFCSP
jgi:flavin-dependent dehydrogenase